MERFKDKIIALKTIAKKTKSVGIIFCLLMTQSCFAESGTSTNYNLDYGRTTGGSEQSESSSYQLTGSLTDESAEGESSSYNLRNIYSDQIVTPVCGNGILEPGEQCDGNNFNGLTCGSYGFNQGNLQCVACSIVTNACSNSGNGGGGGGGGGGGNLIDGKNNICGNGKKEEGEQCDDGNQKDADGCSASCFLEDEELQEKLPTPDEKKEPNSEGQANLEFNPLWDLNATFIWPNSESGKNTGNKPSIDIPKTTNETSSIKNSSDQASPLNANVFFGEENHPSTTTNKGITSSPFEIVEGEPLVILDETPFIAVELKPNTHYEFIILDRDNKVMTRQGVESDKNGLLVAESIKYLNYGDYKIILLDPKHQMVKKWIIRLEDHDYRLQEDLILNNNPHREHIYLGKQKQLTNLKGKGKPLSIYHAYLQGPKTNDYTIHLTAKADRFGNYTLKLPHLKKGIYLMNLIQVYEDGKIGKNIRSYFEIESSSKPLTWAILLCIFIIMLIGLMLKRKPEKSRKTKIALIFIASILSPQISQALDFTPHVLVYEGKLLDSNNNPVVTSQTFRFSMWNSDDLIAGDILGDGSINVGAATYGGWQEVHTLTPNNDGTFFVELGSNTPINEMSINSHLDLQVEIKPAGDPDTSYELMDPTGDNGTDTDDRQTIGSSGYTNNADLIDNADVGTTMGDIATLGFGDMWDINYIPGGTNVDSFTLDSDNTAGPGNTIDLVFGDLLAETIRFDIDNDWFDFSNDINLNQHEIKNVALDNLPVAPANPVAGQIYHNTTDGNSYVWNGVIWEDITAGAGGITVKTTSFNVEYDNSTVEADGSDNKGTLVSHFADEGGVDKYNYYEWTTAETTLQDTDLIISYRLPLDFISFTANPLNVLYKTNDGNTANNAVDVVLYDTTGTAVALVGGSSLASATWATENITFGGLPTFTPGETITIKIKVSTLNTGYSRVSNLTLNYNGS